MMSKTRKVFDKEFKLRAVQMSYESASVQSSAASQGQYCFAKPVCCKQFVLASAMVLTFPMLY